MLPIGASGIDAANAVDVVGSSLTIADVANAVAVAVRAEQHWIDSDQARGQQAS